MRMMTLAGLTQQVRALMPQLTAVTEEHLSLHAPAELMAMSDLAWLQSPAAAPAAASSVSAAAVEIEQMQAATLLPSLLQPQALLLLLTARLASLLPQALGSYLTLHL
jgi:hypothetical protein